MAPSRFQLRLALVLYGGISLAVYMNGMVQELLALLRASHARRLAAKGEHGEWVEQERKQNPYYDLLEAAQTDVTVDVIAGTSAGGLNGLLLAKALASGAHDMAGLSQLWLEAAGIERLAAAEPEQRAMLSGEFLQAELLKVLESLSQHPDPALADLVEVLDLFVPATDVRGHRWVRRDQFRQPLEGIAHKYVFQLKKRTNGSYDQNDFVATAGADSPEQRAKDRLMAKIGRATSAFPGALAPVCITPGDAGSASIEGLKQELGLAGPDGIWFADGGILSNKPFEPVLKAISHRSSDLPVKRILAYLEPDPAQVAPPAQTEPHILETVAASVLLPMVQDIQESLDQVASTNERNRRLRRMANALGQPAVRSAVPEEYYQSRLESLTGWLHELLEKALEGLNVSAQRQARAVEAVLSALPTSDLHAALDAYDVPFQIRRLRYLIAHIEQGLAAEGETRAAVKERLSALWGALDEWRNVAWVLARAGRVDVSQQNRRDSPVVERMAELNQAAQALAGVTQAGGKTEEAAGRVATALTGFLAAVQAAASAREQGAAVRGANAAAAAAEAVDYEQVDMYLLPFQGADTETNWEEVDLYRLSPNAANGWVMKSPDKKLTGVKAGHFGAFFSRRWRANDLMWGRLDGAELLARLVEQEASNIDGMVPAVLSAAAEQVLSTRRRQILADSAEAIDLQQIRRMAGMTGAQTAAPAAVPVQGRRQGWAPSTQMEQEAAAALMADEAETSFLLDPKLVSDGVLQRYLQDYQKIGEEGLKALEPRTLETDLTRMLANATKAISRKPAQQEGWITFLQKPLLALLHTADWVTNLLFFPASRLGGLPLYLAVAGLVLFGLHLLGVIGLSGWGWFAMALLLLPEGIQLVLRLIGAITLLVRRGRE